ncbi:MAG: diacylglycerol/polyprenol kinase family protein [Candidatus Micrarchaeota archaeon]
METRRQLVHIFVGILMIAFALLVYQSAPTSWKEIVEAALIIFLLLGLVIIDLKLKRVKITVVDWLLDVFERPNIMPAHGALWYWVGAMLLISFTSGTRQFCSGIFILSIGDGISTIIGKRFGNHPLPHNKNKTWEGTATFFLASLPAYFFIGAAAFPLALLCALVESMNLHIDDNFTIPLACVLFFQFIA